MPALSGRALTITLSNVQARVPKQALIYSAGMMHRIVVCTFAILLAASCGVPQAQFSYKRDGRAITLTGDFAADVPLEIHVRSERNRQISKLSDRSPNDPDPPRAASPGKEIWFPVVDVELGHDTAVIATFDEVASSDSFCWNGNFWRDPAPLREKNVLSSHIEHWENAIYVESDTARLREFIVGKILPEPDRQQPGFRCLTENWSGAVTIHERRDDALIELATIEIPPLERDPPQLTAGLSRAAIIDAIRMNIDFLIRGQNRNPASPTFGGLYLFYDLDAATYRRSDWTWTWGPAIRFLIDASAIPEITASHGRERLLAVAREMGEASLRYMVRDTGSPAHGLLITRFDPTTRYECGHTAFASPADAYFLAGWGYIPLFEATGNRRFLDASRLMLDQTDRLLAQDPVIEQDYVFASEKWKNWTMDESGFGMEGFAEVHRVTGSEKYRDLGRRYLESLTRVLQRDDGLWDRTWHRKDPAREDDSWPMRGPEGVPIRVPTNANTRGLAWAMMGLLAADRLLPDEGHLEAAVRMARHPQKAQHFDGHWNFLYDRPEAEVGISEKGTAIWSILFYRLHRKTGDPAHLEAARKALQWCLDNRYSEPGDPLAHAGIMGRSPASGVVYRRWFPLICTYTMSFYGNALIAELDAPRRPPRLTTSEGRLQ